MQLWQTLLLLVVFLYALASIFLGYKNLYKKKNPFGLTTFLNPLGAFVWADSVVFGVFFAITSLLCLFAGNFILFCVIYSVFWLVRSIGETIYWIMEQFATTHRNKPENQQMAKYYKGESVYIHSQIFWQCISVISIITSVYLFYLLLKS